MKYLALLLLLASPALADGLSGGPGAQGANPSATCGPSAVNGTALTFMRSDAAPACQKASNAQFGIMEGDGSTVLCTLGVCSIPAGILPYSPPACASFGTTIGTTPTCTNNVNLGMTINAGTLLSSNAIRAFCQNLPSATQFTLTLGSKMNLASYQTGSAFLFITDGTKFMGLGYDAIAAGAGQASYLTAPYFTNTTTLNSNEFTSTGVQRAQFLRFIDDGTNWWFQESQDGTNYATDLKEVNTTHSFGALTQACIGSSAYSNDTSGANQTTQTVFYWTDTTP